MYWLAYLARYHHITWLGNRIFAAILLTNDEMRLRMPLIETERYEIDPIPLGRGGFGETYAARDLLFDRDVVIKTILASRLYGINEPAFRRHFFREALVS